MLRINLLPIRQIKRRARTRNEVIFLVAVLLFVLLGLTGAKFWQQQKVDTLQAEINQLNQKKNSYNPLIAEIGKLKKTKDAIEKKVKVITRLKKQSALAVHVIDEVATYTPENRMWLVSLRQSGSQLSLQGIALDNATIAQYMEEMSSSPYFTNAELSNSSLMDVAGQKLKSFSMTFTIVVPKEKNG